MTKSILKRLESEISNKCLRSVLTKLLEADKNQKAACVIFRVKGTNRVKLMHVDGKIVDSLELFERCNSRERVIIDIVLIKKHTKKNEEEIEIPVMAQSCPVHGCLDCELPDCDEECPPGECQ